MGPTHVVQGYIAVTGRVAFYARCAACGRLTPGGPTDDSSVLAVSVFSTGGITSPTSRSLADVAGSDKFLSPGLIPVQCSCPSRLRRYWKSSFLLAVAQRFLQVGPSGSPAVHLQMVGMFGSRPLESDHRVLKHIFFSPSRRRGRFLLFTDPCCNGLGPVEFRVAWNSGLSIYKETETQHS